MDENIVKDKVTGEGLEYNTQRGSVVLSQYGRNIDKLVNHALTIEDRRKRNLAAEQIIAAMEILNPKIRFIDEYKKVLWNHLAMMSGHKLDVDYPYEIIPEDEIKSKPEAIPLIKKRIQKRQYGRIIGEMIKIAIEMTDEEEKKEFIQVILIQMKRTYIEWNKDVVSDDVIFDDFKKLSNNQLVLPVGFKLPQSYELRNKYKNVPNATAKRPRRDIPKNTRKIR
ncbi:MAG: DUF4290 domain-containing protein [Bacteroidales bacterium]|nr:DUF4290 domain-containing protein [Bacteroidales bacterium]